MDDLTFSNIKAVAEYLQSTGWKIGRASVYQHAKDGKIIQREDGFFYLKDVKRYARKFLKRLDFPKRSGADLEKIQERRIKAEVVKLEAQAEHWILKAKKISENYVPLANFEIDIALRTVYFRSRFKEFLQSELEGIIQECEGDQSSAPELESFLKARMDEWLLRYGQPAKDNELRPDLPIQLPDDDAEIEGEEAFEDYEMSELSEVDG